MAKEKKPGSAKIIEGAAEEVQKKKKRTSPADFVRQVMAEGRKVTWTTRNETMISTIMVLIMVTIMSVFFLLVDTGLRLAVTTILKF
ncbi:MAG: preprotein translocase subunit SecE [Parvularculaceae bacterium]